MTLNLNGEWDLYYGPCSVAVEDLESARQKLSFVKAKVPGDTYLDLHRAGIIDDPFFADNFHRLSKYELYQWWYHRDFDFTPAPGKQYELVFKGLDTVSTIWLNGKKIGSAQNALIEHRFEVTDLLCEHNSLVVKIESPIAWASKHQYDAEDLSWEGREEAVWLRKPQHSFGWDIAPRLVSSGIWKDVYIIEKDVGIKELYFATANANRESATLDVFYVLHSLPEEGTKIVLTLRPLSQPDRPTVCEFPVEFSAGHLSVNVKEPLLWWPKGYGNPELYEARVSLVKENKVIDERVTRIGIRTVHLERSVEKGLFRFVVNGVPIRLRGSNWTPLDAFHSRDAERLDSVLQLAEDLGCNVLRCWGGGVYEDDKFYDFCDEHGIAIWQDFAMACARYPQSEEFASMIKEEVTATVKRLRNHPSIFLWAGDNECDLAYKAENLRPDDNALTRKVIPEVLKRTDPYRPYIPSSPYISGEEGMPMPEDHLWGPRDYYKSEFYTQNTASFISEIGYHGCPSVQSLKKFLPEQYLWPPQNPGWRAHSVDHWKYGNRSHNRVELMLNQVREVFGEVPNSLEEFVMESQIAQAEALKFFVERARLSDNIWGIIWWNIIDPWPQFSDSVVDYYFEKKLAYHYLKRVQRPFIISLTEPQNWAMKVVAINDTFSDAEGFLEIRDDEEKLVFSKEFSAERMKRSVLGKIEARRGERKLYVITWTLKGSEKSFRNHYILAYPPLELQEYLNWLKLIGPFND